MALWREIAIVALMALLGLMTTAYMSKRDQLVEVTAGYETRLAAGRQAMREIEDRSARALETLRAEHLANTKEVERNAWILFKRRYPQYAGCLQPQPPVPSGGETTVADRPQPPDDPGKEFVVGCAADATQITEFQRWVRLNRFPVEGE